MKGPVLHSMGVSLGHSESWGSRADGSCTLRFENTAGPGAPRQRLLLQALLFWTDLRREDKNKISTWTSSREFATASRKEGKLKT